MLGISNRMTDRNTTVVLNVLRMQPVYIRSPIGYARLQAFPTAKRCIACQELREKTRASPPRGTR